MPSLMREDSISRSQLTPLTFTATDVPDAAGAAPGEVIAPWTGYIVGISASSSAAFTTGTVTVRPTINGTGNTGVTTALSNSNQRNYKKLALGSLRFAAGTRLGVDWTKSGTVAPVTNDVTVTLWVMFETDI